jgi:hypothetical protein
MKIYLLANRNFWGRQSLQPGSNQNSQNPKIFEEAVTGVFSKGNCRLRQTMALNFWGRQSLQPGSNQNSQNPKIFEEAVTGVFSKAFNLSGCIELMSLLVLLIHANITSTCL